MRIFRQLLVLSFAALLAGCTTGATPPAIVVGHVADNKRADQAGEHAEFGIRLALNELTKDGTLADTFGGKKIQVNHTKTDGEIDAFESQAVRLFNVNRAVAILGGTSPKEVAGLDHVKAPILTFQGQPVVGASNQVFYLGMSASQQGEVLGKVIAENEKTRQVVFVQDERRTDGAAFVDAFQKAMGNARRDAKAAAPIFMTVRFGKEPAWKDVLERALTPTPQALVFVGEVDDFNNWRRIALREFSIDEIEIVYAGNDGDQRQFERADKQAPFVLFATAFYPDPASEKFTAFRKTCKEKFQFDADVHAALAHDGMRVLVDAIKKNPGQVVPEKIHETLLKTKDFEGLTGPLTITAERQVLRPLHVLRGQSDAATLVKTFPTPK